MGRYRILYIVVIAFLFAAPFADGMPQKRANKAEPNQKDSMVDPVKSGYVKERESSFYYTEGIKQASVHKNPEKALEYFDKAIQLDPLHSPSYYEAANTLAVTNPEKALEYSMKANEIDSTDVWYKGQLARLLLNAQEYDQAQKIYENLIVLSPKNPENYSMLAALYEYSGMTYSAIALLDKAETILGKSEELTRYKRELLIGVQQYDRAIEEGRELVISYPYNYESYLSLALLYGQTGNDSLARENFNIALSLNPNGVDVIGSMGEYYKYIGDHMNYLAMGKKLFQSDDFPFEAKVKFFKDITSDRNFYRDFYFQIKDLASTLVIKYPKVYEATDLYAGTLAAWGDLEEALSVYKNFITDTITDIRPYINILDIEGYNKRQDSLMRYTELALEKFPKNAELYIRQGRALAYMKKTKEAEKAYNNALKYTESDSAKSVVYGILGDMYHEIKEPKKSYSSYQKAIKLWNDNTVVLNNYAYYLSVENRDLDKALAMSEKVVKVLEPGNPTYIDTYGWVLYRLGRFEEARKAIQQAIALDPDGNKELLLHYGDILYALGENYMATVYWKRALDAGYDEEEIEQRIKIAEDE